MYCFFLRLVRNCIRKRQLNPVQYDVVLSVVEVVTVSQTHLSWKECSSINVYNSYLPGKEDTVITKAVHPGRGSAIALRLC